MNKNYLIKLKSVFILLFLCLLHDEAVAQNMLSGRVLDGNKNPLTAVTIANLTQKTGTSTDENGNFSIRSKKWG